MSKASGAFEADPQSRPQNTLHVGLDRIGSQTITLAEYKRGETVVEDFDPTEIKGAKVDLNVDPSDPRLINNRSKNYHGVGAFREGK